MIATGYAVGYVDHYHDGYSDPYHDGYTGDRVPVGVGLSPFTLVRTLAGQGHAQKPARDPAPLRYVGVPPTSQLGWTPALHEGIPRGMGAPSPTGR